MKTITISLAAFRALKRHSFDGPQWQEKGIGDQQISIEDDVYGELMKRALAENKSISRIIIELAL